jgi:hypothetical protein
MMDIKNEDLVQIFLVQIGTFRCVRSRSRSAALC